MEGLFVLISSLTMGGIVLFYLLYNGTKACPVCKTSMCRDRINGKKTWICPTCGYHVRKKKIVKKKVDRF
jgi:uncharacterized Zn finger protein (UPF0148 family)